MDAKPTPRSDLREGESTAGSAPHLRRLNIDRMLAFIMDQPGPFTRAQLTQATGLSAPTVGSVVNRLIRAGIVRELGTGPSRGGRRPAFMDFNAQHALVGGIDLGPTRTRMAVADLNGEVLARGVIPTPSGLDPQGLLHHIAEAMRSLMRQAKVEDGRLFAVGAGAPGAVDRRMGSVVALAPNLQGWTDVPMGAILEGEFGAPVVLENDVNLAVLGERWKGAARGHDTCAFISVGTGIGAGLVVGGELHRGHHSLAGEIGLMCMGAEYLGKDFGTKGCLETLAGLKALGERSGGPLGASGQWLAELFEAARRGEAPARQAVGDVARLLGMATASLSVVLDPSLVVLGGSLAMQGEPLLADVRRIVGQIVPRPPEIVVSALDKEAPLWGCLLLSTTEARFRLRRTLSRATTSEA